MEKEIGKLMKISRYSCGVVLPKEFVKKLKWKEKQKVRMTRIKGGIVIRDYRSS